MNNENNISTDEETAIKLKPCPMCGGNPEIEVRCTSRVPPFRFAGDVSCLCGVNFQHKDTTRELITQQWNRRASDAELGKMKIITDNSKVNENLLAENENLRRKVERYEEMLNRATRFWVGLGANQKHCFIYKNSKGYNYWLALKSNSEIVCEQESPVHFNSVLEAFDNLKALEAKEDGK